jgi:hypothetical protein
VREVERIALREVERELAALGAEPEAILAAEDIHVRLPGVRGDRLASDPPEAGRGVAADRARQHAALVLGGQHHLTAGGVAEHEHRRVPAQEFEVGREGR